MIRPLENQVQLLLGDGVVGTEAAVAVAAHQLVAGRPADGLGVPLALRHVGELHEVVHHRPPNLPPQDSDQHSPGESSLRLEAALPHSVHQLMGPNVVYRFRVPSLGVHVGKAAGGGPEANRGLRQAGGTDGGFCAPLGGAGREGQGQANHQRQQNGCRARQFFHGSFTPCCFVEWYYLSTDLVRCKMLCFYCLPCPSSMAGCMRRACNCFVERAGEPHNIADILLIWGAACLEPAMSGVPFPMEVT